MGVVVDNNNQGSGSRGRRKASVAETLAMWESSSSVNRRAPAKGSRKGCMRGKGGPDNSKFNYRGVRQKLNGKWVSEIRVPGEKKKLWLGTFQTAIQAAFAYDDAAKRLYGSAARLNLPPGASAGVRNFRGFWNRSNQYQLSVGRWRGHCHLKLHLICLLARSMMICCSMCRGFRNRSNQYQLSVGMRRGHWNSPAWIPSDQGGLTKHGRLS